MSSMELERRLFQFGYDATETTTRRKPPVTTLRGEDDLLPGFKRDTLSSTARDAARNYAIAASMIRKHLDFVSEFNFEANTPNREFNNRLRDVMQTWSKRRNCHISRRHPLRRIIRMAEFGRVVDGDCLIELVKGGREKTARINLIRGDRIRNRTGSQNTDELKNGIRISPVTGEALAYQIHKRTTYGRMTFEKEIGHRHAIQHGYFTDSEQYRGVSPLSVAINNFRDTYEGIDFALARMKAEMLIGFAIETDPSPDVNPWQGNRQFDKLPEDMTPEELVAYQEQVANQESERGEIDFGKGIFFAELRKGESLKSVSGNMPSSNAQAFWDTSIMIAMKALDLPFSFYREDFTNFFGSRGALQLYKLSANNKQADNAELLEEIACWVLTYMIIYEGLELPRGWTIQDLAKMFLWVPRGIPWWDRSKEVIGDMRAISSGLDTPQNVCLDHGNSSFERNVDQIDEAVGYWNSKANLKSFTPAFLSMTKNDETGSAPKHRRKRSAKKDDE